MDPFFAFAAEFWWMAPVLIGAGAASFAGLRYGRHRRARALEYTSARHEWVNARARLLNARAEAKNAQASLLVAKSARQGGQGSSRDVESARRGVGEAQRELRSAQLALRGRRVQVKAAKALLRRMPRGDEHLPLTRLYAAHDAVIARWMSYETDPAKAIAFPSMTDARVPATSALLTAMENARTLRPRPSRPTPTAADYASYRSAVISLESAFRGAEESAWRAAGASGVPSAPAGEERDSRLEGDDPQPGIPAELRDAWDDLVVNTRAAAASAVAAATASARDAVWRVANNPRSDGPPRSGAASPSPSPDPSADPPAPADEATTGAARRPIWPIPRRSAD